jgi:hypothetical protein
VTMCPPRYRVAFEPANGFAACDSFVPSFKWSLAALSQSTFSCDSIERSSYGISSSWWPQTHSILLCLESLLVCG